MRTATLKGKDLQALRRAVKPRAASRGPVRWNAQPEEVQQSVAKLVLSLAEFLRQLLERQAIRRMEEGTLTARETEAVGLALMRLEAALADVASQFGLSLDDLNLDLGPIGRLNQ